MVPKISEDQVSAQLKEFSSVFRVTSAEAGKRADVVLSQHLPVWSRSRVKRLIETGVIYRLSGKVLKPGSKLVLGEEIAIKSGESEGETGVRGELEAEPIPLKVIYEDEYVLAVDKPAGLVVHPALAWKRGTLVNALLYRYRNLPQIPGREWPGIVHRLDRDTSGIILIAKDEFSQWKLSQQFQKRQVKKEYHAIVWGSTVPDRMVLNGYIGRNPRDRKKMMVGGVKGRDALTRVEVLKRFPGFVYLRAFPETGRTHQIRVHLASVGHPVVGDWIYGRGKTFPAGIGEEIKEAISQLEGFALHAYSLEFEHPVQGSRMKIVASLPETFQNLLVALEFSLKSR